MLVQEEVVNTAIQRKFVSRSLTTSGAKTHIEYRYSRTCLE